MKTALSVNVNKVALLRNSRDNGLPSVLQACETALRAGAAGITIHPRPDERHIRRSDVADIAALMQQWPAREFNIEGNPLHNLMDIIRAVRPHQATFVPDSMTQSTSDHGWDLAAQGEVLRPLIAECRSLGVRVSLFMDAEEDHMAAAKTLGADRVELYTESWAKAYGSPQETAVLTQFQAAARAAAAAGLGVNAGHDLSLHNLRAFALALPELAEVSIGHALIADALELGLAGAVQAYLACLE
jgi:pyridoxine 5-phosphate synthase